MLYTLFSTHPIRMSAVMLLSLTFSMANAFIPIFLGAKSLKELVCLWFFIHFSGRIQTLVFVPLSISIRATLLNPCPTLCLQSPKVTRQSIQQQIYQIEMNTRFIETLLFQGLPAGMSLLARVLIIQYIHPQTTGYAIGIIFCSSVIWYLMLNPVTRAIHHYHEALSKLNIEQVDVLLDQVFFKTRHSIQLAQRQYRQRLWHKEGLKSVCALWIIVVLAIGFHSGHKIPQIEQFYTFCLIWLGFSDQIWSLWNVLIECSTTPFTPTHTPSTKHQTINHIVFNKAAVLPVTIPINLTISRRDVVWIEGENGVGKTSLLRAIQHPKFLHSGSIVFDPTPNTLTCVITAYMQPSRGTIKDYINSDIATIIGLNHHIESLPDQYHTPIDHLPNWSMGMLQKLSLGWAIQQKASVYLLDECCHHLPIADELSFYKNLQQFNPDAIIMIVSHQLNHHSFLALFPKGRHLILKPSVSAI